MPGLMPGMTCLALASTVLVAFMATVCGAAAPTYSPVLPPSYPLAVRNPYLSAWMPGALMEDLPTTSPQFWGGQNLTWGIMARVDGVTYNLMGITAPPANSQSATLIGANYSATHTLFRMSVGGSVEIDLDFFSPVSPQNYLRQSLPFSYLSATVSGYTGSSIQIYTDIDDTWTGQTGATAYDFTMASNSTAVYSMSVNDAYEYSENSDMALWGNVTFATVPVGSGSLSKAAGSASTVRGQFASGGSLNSTSAGTSGDVVAFAQSLPAGTTSVTFAVGYVREAAINYLGTPYTGYYVSEYPDTPSAVAYFLSDFASALAESQTVDNTIEGKATAVAGTNYSDITTLSTRQVFGALDLVIPLSSLDTTTPMAFLKEISSDGNVNTMDVIYPTHPALYVLGPTWIKLLLEPVLAYLATGAWQQPYCIHDIGSAYPNATGHDDQDDESMPIEETGNMLILVAAYASATGDISWATTGSYGPILQGYADYLVQNGLNISSQLSTDDGAGALANQTNLAIKAAVGLTAYGALTDQTNYTSVGKAYASAVATPGVGLDTAGTHLTLAYPNDGDTFTTAFNLFPDQLLNLSTFDASIYALQSAYYPTVRATAGVPLDSRVDWGKTDWMHFCGAYCATTTRDMFIDDVWAFMTDVQPNQVPFSDRFYVNGSDADEWDGYRARPVVGGHFAVLALEGADQLDTSTTSAAAATTTGNSSASGAQHVVRLCRG